MIQISNLIVRIAGRLLFEGGNLSLPEGAKAGLVGRNGTGKTTLFKVLNGDHPTESGDISLPRSARLGQVAQEAPATDDSLIDIVLAADTERVALLAEAERAKDPETISDIQTRLMDIDAHAAPARAAAILAGLGFDKAAQARPAASFSGGWRMRVALAAVLFSQPDILLLDEPTNYLDLEGTLWLESFIARYPGTVIIISHDRDLLNTAVKTIVHLENRKFTVYRGNYDSFVEQRLQAAELAEKALAKQDAKRKHMQAFVDRFRAKASKARQAQSRLKALEKLQPIAALTSEQVIPISLPEPMSIPSSPILKLEGVSCGYDAENPVLTRVNQVIAAEDRIALLGANGNGKSTFAKLLMDRLPHVNGTITKAPKLKIAMFAQHQLDDLRPQETPVEHVRAILPDEPEAKIRSRVSRMGLSTERMDTKAKDLSGGERARLLLGLITFEGPNLLILDEPTNHLDVEARQSLIEALNDYSGAVILISHDRTLIDATVDQLWIVRSGTVQHYDGDMEAYRAEILSRGKTDTATGKSTLEKEDNKSQAAQRAAAAARRKSNAPLKQEITRQETLLAKIDDAISKIDAKLSEPGFYDRAPERVGEFAKKRSELEKKKAEVEERWLELTSEYEAAIEV